MHTYTLKHAPTDTDTPKHTQHPRIPRIKTYTPPKHAPPKYTFAHHIPKHDPPKPQKRYTHTET